MDLVTSILMAEIPSRAWHFLLAKKAPEGAMVKN